MSAFNFEKIYNMGECTNSNVTEFLGWQSGGRIEFYKDLLLLTVGDFRNRVIHKIITHFLANYSL